MVRYNQIATFQNPMPQAVCSHILFYGFHGSWDSYGKCSERTDTRDIGEEKNGI